jgi:2'-5' RNA ligase
MARLFVAVWPPEDVVDELCALHRKDRRGVRFVAPENWHVTLRFLGDANPDEAAAALDQLSAAPARARLGPAVDVLGERALVIPVAGLDELAGAVGRLTAAIGRPERRRFVGHLTIARLKAPPWMPPTLGSLVSAEFDVREVALVQSRLERDGARYETVQTWALDGS